MIFFLYLTIIAVCQAARIPRGIEHPYFPNLRTVYHGHGATSYQNVEIHNGNHIAVPSNYEFEHAAIPTQKVIYHNYADLLDHANHYDLNVQPIFQSSREDVDYIAEDADPLDEVAEHSKVGENFVLSRYDHYDDSQDYEHH